jgi:hypothetical protein
LSPVPILIAAGIGLVASELGVLPIIVKRGGDAGDRFLKGLVGTVLHLGACVVLAAVAIFGFKLGSAFVYCMLGAYWITLIGLCMVLVRLLRGPVESAKLSTN